MNTYRMRLLAGLAIAVLLAACGGDDDTSSTQESAGWLDQWDDSGFDERTVDGNTVLVDEDEQVIYVEDCGVARTLTEEGGEFGPTDSESGYGFICS